MPDAVKKILNEALNLSEQDRAFVAEQLLSSLSRPDSVSDRVWAREAEARLDAYNRGEIHSVPLEKIFSKYNTS